jgi:hypothetical protein
MVFLTKLELDSESQIMFEGKVSGGLKAERTRST